MEILKHFILQLAFVHSWDIVTATTGREKCSSEVASSRNYVKTYGDTCYMFVDNEKFWDEARSYCWKMGGEMLYVEDKLTMDFIKGVLNSRELGWSNNGVWLGASDLRDNGWEWTTGKKLSYSYWADGEPSKTFGFLSFENCGCMRRSDNWRWHDYHCHMHGFEYKFICQFPMINSKTYEGSQTNSGAPLQVERDDRVLVIVLIVAGIGLLFGISVVVFFLYRKQQHQKREHQRYTARFQNTGYATIMQEIPRDDSSSGSSMQPPERPVSNIYLDPMEVNRPPVYDEVGKDASIPGANSVDARIGTDVHETRRLVYTGGASSAGNLAAAGMSNSPSDASGATSGYFSGRSGVDCEYIEMSGGNSMGSLNGHSGESHSVDSLKNCKGGATGSVHDLKSSNMYVTPVFCDGKSPSNACMQGREKEQPEVHIYSNRLDEIENNSLTGIRPLPPLPKDDVSMAVKGGV